MHFHIPQRSSGAYRDIIAGDADPSRSMQAPENVQLVMNDGKLSLSEIKELANWSKPGSGSWFRHGGEIFHTICA
jgi:hypothetical protein